MLGDSSKGSFCVAMAAARLEWAEDSWEVRKRDGVSTRVAKPQSFSRSRVAVDQEQYLLSVFWNMKMFLSLAEWPREEATERKGDAYVLFGEIGSRACWLGFVKIPFLRNNLK